MEKLLKHKKYNIPAIVMNLCINGLGVVRALGQRGVPVIGLYDEDTPAPGLYSRYLTETISCKGSDRDKVDLLIKTGKEWGHRPVLFPITDLMVRSIAERLEQLRKYYRIGLPESKQIVDKMISKRGFAGLISKIDLPAPLTFFVEDADALEEVAQKMNYPCIIKPDYRSIGFLKTGMPKALIAGKPSELINIYKGFSRGESRVVIQEWVPGGDGDVFFCLQYYGRDGDCLGSFGGRKIRQWPPLSGGTASCEPVEIEKIETLSTKFFSFYGFKGLCSMEFKRHLGTGEFLLIEPTIGRTDWQSDVANANGIPLPYIAYLDLTMQGVPEVAKKRRKIRWVRWSADYMSAKQYMRRKELTWMRWVSTILGPIRWSIWSVKDPKPFILRVYHRIIRRVTRKNI